MKRANEIIERLKCHPRVKGQDVPVGAFSVMCKGVKVEEDNGSYDMTVVITTDDIDLDDEVIAQDAIDFGYLTANTQLFVDHEYNTLTHTAGFLRGPLGKWPSTKDHRGWKARVRLYDNPAGEAVKLIASQSGQIGLSIGFYPTDHGPLTEDERARYTVGGKTPSSIIRKLSVFEFSFTALPCNVSCQGQLVAVGGGEKQVAVLSDLVDAGKIDRKVAVLLGDVQATPDIEKYRVATPHGVLVKSRASV